MEGVGKVEVVLSLESTNQKVVEKDVPASREQSGKLRRSGEQQRFIGHHRGEHGVPDGQRWK